MPVAVIKNRWIGTTLKTVDNIENLLLIVNTVHVLHVSVYADNNAQQSNTSICSSEIYLAGPPPPPKFASDGLLKIDLK